MTPSAKRVMVPIILFLLPILSTTAAYSSVPFCLTSGVTFNSPMTGFPTVTTPEECQQLCTDSSDCNTITWYDSQASPLPNYCMMFHSPDESEQVSCTECVSGPESCLCSGLYTCSVNSDQLIELMFAITTEFQCAELCSNNSNCEYYSWFTEQNNALKETCALLKGCSERTSSDTCHSGPANCENKDIIISIPPQCTDYKQLSSYTRNVLFQGEVCNGDYCCDVSGSSNAHPDWAGEAWYRFTGLAGTRLAEFPPGQTSCGTPWPGYMVGGRPTVEEGEATRTVYFDKSGDGTPYDPKDIKVINCHNFYVYLLKDVDSFNHGYCGE